MSSAMQSKDTRLEQDQIRSQLAQIFTPSVPIEDPKLFSGREELLVSMRDQLAIPGRVFILYGERGVGKTSFYNVLLHNLDFVKYSCTSKDSFITIFLNILRSLGEHFTETEITNLVEAGYEIGVEKIVKATAKAKASNEKKVAPILPEPLDQASIIRRLKKVQVGIDAIVFDEFQKLKDLDIHAQMNDLVKALSDEQVKVRVFFVGIAESDEELFPPSKSYTEYKMRHYIAVKIPRMNKRELEDIINRRKNIYNIQFIPEAITELTNIASGYPSIAHTLALNSCFAWLTLSAGKFIKNWLVKHLSRFIGVTEFKVEKINMEVGEQEFSMGVVQFLKSFHSSYEKETKQFLNGLTSTNIELNQKIFLLLAESEGGIPTSELANMLGIPEKNLINLIRTYPSLIIRDKKKNICHLGFSHLRTIIRAYDYLHRRHPEQFRNLINSNSTLVKESFGQRQL